MRHRWRKYVKWAYLSIPVPAMEDFSTKCQKSPLWYFLGAFALQPCEQITIFERMGKPDYVKARLLFMPMILCTNKRDLNIASTLRKAFIVETYRPFIGFKGLLFQEGEKAKRDRQMLNHGFGQTIYRTIHPVMLRSAERLRQRMLDLSSPDHGGFNVEPLVARSALESVAEACFGLELHKENNYKYEKALKTMLLLPGNPLCMLPLGSRFVQWYNRDLIHQVHELVHSAIAKRMEARRLGVAAEDRDLLDVVISASLDAEGNVESDWVRDQVQLLFIGGSDTTGKALSWAFIMLAARPDIQTRVRREVLDVARTENDAFDRIGRGTYLHAFLREVLRMYAPVEAIPRRLNDAETQFRGIPVADTKWTSISYHNHFAHRRDDYFPNPDKFDPNRWLVHGSADRRAFGAFSDGFRACLGRNFALTVMKTKLCTVLLKHRIEALHDIGDLPQLGFSGQLAAPVGNYPLRLVKADDR